MTDNDHSDDDISALLRIGLDEGLDETRRVGRSSSWDPPSVEELQRALPQYEITAFIARGGMGAVYKGTQKALGRTVAIKVLPRGLEDVDGRFAARFKSEAKAMARLSHPNIVTVYEAGETRSGDIPAATPGETGDRNVAAPWAAGGMLYFVMEFIDGTDVAKLIASEGFVGPQRAMEITTAVCEALAFAHEEGIIHRDIKPSNILLDSKGRVKVADFGLARMTDPDHAMRSVAETMIGTPDFMAPEALIQGMRVDQRADIYAVGVMLYQMLTGSVPRGRFAPPSSLRPGVDRALDAVVDKALQTNREQRYSTAGEMKTAINKVAPSVNSRRIADTQGTESMKRDGRMRVAALIVTIAVSVGLLAAGVFIVMKKRTKWSAQSPVRQGAVEATGTTAQGTVRTTSAATKDAPFVNSLGMKFVPVPILGGPTRVQRVLFSVWDTRVQDYEVFIEETEREWPTADFPQEPTHPAIHVSWDDAQLFCQWLTARDQAAGKLGANERYRLPSDHEWSCAVGIGAREDAAKLPSAKDGLITDVYPWGTEWPPPKGAGNYGGEESQPDPSADGKRPAELVALGYNDGFVNTSPVGSFAANRFGLHDLGGNVRQWCEDWFDQHQKERVLRGASWNGRRPGLLLSSRRSPNEPGLGGHLNGFRCVLAGSAAAGTAAPSQ